MKEKWKDILGYIGCYKVSTEGRVLSYGKYKSNKFLKPCLTKKGYLKVCLCKNSIGKVKVIHRLVAQTFIPNPKKLAEVNHKNGNKLDNRKVNLEWNTTQDNISHAFKNNLKPRDKKGKFKKLKL